MSSWLRLAVVLMAFASPILASATPETETRVALLDPASSLLDAVAVALSPWGLQVVSVTAPIPGPDVATATEAARALAHERSAGALVWIAASAGSQGASLWLYDTQTEQMTVRPLSQLRPSCSDRAPAQPGTCRLDEASAAAVALTIKTLLRSTTVAPPMERPSVSSAHSASSLASETASSASSPPTPSPRSEAAKSSASPSPAPTPLPPTGLSSSWPTWRIDALAFAQLPTGTGASVAWRAGLGLSWWPRAWHERVGFGADVKAGTSLDITTQTFAGSFSDTVVGLSARARLGGTPWSVELVAGPSLHITSLSGAAVDTGRASSVQRGDPALDADVVPQISLGARLRVGVFLGASVLLRTQRYTLNEDVVVRLPPVGFDLGGRASLALD